MPAPVPAQPLTPSPVVHPAAYRERPERGRPDRALGRRHRNHVPQPAAQRHGSHEVPNLPTAGAGDGAKGTVRVHRDRMPNGLEHRDVGDGVGVGVAGRKVDAAALRLLVDRLRLCRRVAEELECPVVAPFLVNVRARGEHERDSQILGERTHDLDPGGGHQVQVTSRPTVILEQLEGLLVDERINDLMERFPHEPLHPGRLPSAGELQEGHSQVLHAFKVPAEQLVGRMCVGPFEHGGR